MSANPCAACRLRRCKCTPECIFAPYFPPNLPQRFAIVHRVFGASNIAKILNELPVEHRQDAVNSLFYEAHTRIQDPVYGCVGLIAYLQQRLKQVNRDLVSAKTELAYQLEVAVNSAVPYMPVMGNPPLPNFTAVPYGWVPAMGMQQQQQQQQGQHLTEFDMQRMEEMFLNRGEQGNVGGYGIDVDGAVTATGFNQMDAAGPSLALGFYSDAAYQTGQEPGQEHGIDPYQLQTQLVLQPPTPQDQTPRGEAADR
ncbi:PREDICTED: LOB domain-containing protein 10-like [Tarenaya hassleriana]|uniref:LOB domain-containing protein 10-like n=1 Tax=Tarenaya hassleriana TaxID=28532 RepID=UPI00053C53AC|nr:PREDICTED: LOB domain-containing protein 10-like [Tarenaya hassleriana]